MRGIAGYGRYDDDPEHIGCPRAQSDMTPCIARDGALALASRGECVGCGESAIDVFVGFGTAYEPARKYRHTKDVDKIADRLRDMVREATAP